MCIVSEPTFMRVYAFIVHNSAPETLAPSSQACLEINI